MHTQTPRTAEDIQTWLVSHIARELELDLDSIDVWRPLARYGLDSLVAVGLSGELETWLGRSLSPSLLAEYPSIEALAHHLANETPRPCLPEPGESQRPVRTGSADFSKIDYGRWLPIQRLIQNVLSLIVRLLGRVHIEGLEHFPASGPFVLAINHLHVFDTPLVFSLLPRPTVFLVSDHLRRVPFVNWFLTSIGNTIWVARGEGDYPAIESALTVLRAGGVLAVAPEGKISKVGALLKGRTGIAYLATQTGVPVLPAVAYGQERAFESWIRLCRVPIQLRIGPLIRLPAGKATAKQLESYTDAVMVAMAKMLPAEYQGVYRDAVQASCGDLHARL